MRDHLLDFHEQWYSANIMTLAIISNHSLADMQTWAAEYFKPIKNFDVQVPFLGEPPAFPPGQLSKVIKYIPIQDYDQLMLVWALPLSTDEKTKPLSYLAFLFGHEGDNSLLSYLKSEGLALALGAGAQDQLDSFSIFEVSITLSEKGLQNYQLVIEAVFEYAQMLERAGP